MAACGDSCDIVDETIEIRLCGDTICERIGRIARPNWERNKDHPYSMAKIDGLIRGECNLRLARVKVDGQFGYVTETTWLPCEDITTFKVCMARLDWCDPVSWYRHIKAEECHEEDGDGLVARSPTSHVRPMEDETETSSGRTVRRRTVRVYESTESILMDWEPGWYVVHKGREYAVDNVADLGFCDRIPYAECTERRRGSCASNAT